MTVKSMRKIAWLIPLLTVMNAGAANGVQFGRCDVQVGTSLIGIASAGVDDSGKPVLLALQGGTSSRVIRIAIDPPTLARACNLAVSVLNITLGTFVPQGLAVGDVDGDRLLDFVVAGSDGVAGHDLLVYVGSGDAEFSQDLPTPFRQARDGTNAVAIADVDRDGVVDLVAGSGADSSVTILYSGTTRSEALAVQGVSAGNLAVGFIDDDGLPDITTGSSGSGRVSALYQTSARTFRASSSPTTFATRAFGLTDLDHDLISDLLVVRDSASALDLYRGPLANLESITMPSLSLMTGAAPVALAPGDFSGDGSIDVAVANRDESSVSLFVGNGLGNLEQNSLLAGCRATNAAQRCVVGTSPSALVAADANGGPLDLDQDGIGDIVVANGNGTISLLLSADSSANSTPTPSATPVTPRPSATFSPTSTATPNTSCCENHSAPGCAVSACSACVCANDSRCCAVEWDDICIGFARSQLCESECGCPGPTVTGTATPTSTETLSPIPSETPTVTTVPTHTPTATETRTGPPAPATRTPTSTQTVTGTLPTVTRTASRTATPSETPTAVPTATVQFCGGGLCVNGEGCNVGQGSDSAGLALLSFVPLLWLLARRSASRRSA